VPELATFMAFAFLTALLVYVIVQVPLTPEPVVDLDDNGAPCRGGGPRTLTPSSIAARIVFIDCGRRTTTVDGVELTTGQPFAIEVGRPEGWSAEDTGRQLRHWAANDTVIELQLHDDLRGRRAWMGADDVAIDFPLAGVLGVVPNT
jgi:hypothetical protein